MAEPSRDPRIVELERMGLQRVHLRVAEAIGFDAFMAMWKVYDADPSVYSHRTRMLQPLLRPFQSYLRFQRNRYIEELGADGLSIEEIQSRVKDELSERLSARQIARVLGKK